MREKGDEKFFTKLVKCGNIKTEIQLQFLFLENLSSKKFGTL